jgi:hypothetical protein
MEIAGYTYGPLLGLLPSEFSPSFRFQKIFNSCRHYFGSACYLLINYLITTYTDYRIGVELIVLNGLLTFIGLWLVRHKSYLKIVD